MKKIISILGIIILLALGYYYYQQSQKDKNTKEPVEQKDKEVIKVGAILPLTGKLAVIGEGERNGFKMALDSIKNKYPNKIVKLIIEDFHSETKNAVTIANKLIKIDKVDAIITSTTAAAEAVSPIIETNKIIHFVISPDVNILKKTKFNYRVYYNFNTEANVINHFLLKNKKSNKKEISFLAVRYSSIQKEIDEKIEPFVLKNGFSVKSKEYFSIQEKDFKNYISKIADFKPNFLFLAPQVNQVELLTNQLSERKIFPSKSLDIICSFTFNWRPQKFLKTLDNYYIASPKFIIANNNNNRYYLNYSRAYGTPPSFDTMYAYDNLIILTELLIISKNNNEFSKNFNSKKVYYGASGEIIFKGNNDTDTEIILTKIINNNQIAYE